MFDDLSQSLLLRTLSLSGLRPIDLGIFQLYVPWSKKINPLGFMYPQKKASVHGMDSQMVYYAGPKKTFWEAKRMHIEDVTIYMYIYNIHGIYIYI